MLFCKLCNENLIFPSEDESKVNINVERIAVTTDDGYICQGCSDVSDLFNDTFSYEPQIESKSCKIINLCPKCKSSDYNGPKCLECNFQNPLFLSKKKKKKKKK